MPNLLIPIENTLDSVSRPVAKSVIDKIIHLTSLDKTTRVEIRGEQQKASQPGSEIDDIATPDLRLLHDGRVIVSFRETYVDTEVINAEVRHPYAQPIFADPTIGVHIKPIYSATEMELNFTYRAKSKQEAAVWRDDVKMRMADNRQSHLHEAMYHFPVPDFCSLLLKHVYELREAQAGYGDSLGDYLQEHYTKRAKVLSTQSGNDRSMLLVIGETQVGIQGWFDFDLPVEEEKNEGGPSYLVQFNYKFSYHKPISLNVVYPQIIHNQLISPDFIVMRERTEDPLSLPTYKSDYRFALDHFDLLARIPRKPLGGTSIPEYDEWIPDSVQAYTTSLINWMVVFSQRNMVLALDEADIHGTGFTEDVMALMRIHGDKMVHLGQSPFHFGIFRGKEPVADGVLKVNVTDTAFTIETTEPVDLRQSYHLRLSFCTEIEKYSEAALLDMHVNGLVTLKIFQSVVNRLDVEDAFANHMTADGKLSISYIKKFFGWMRHQQYGGVVTPGGSHNNNLYPSDTWLNDKESFGHRMDKPYVEILTIIALKRNKV
jgi:hypothetical protein